MYKFINIYNIYNTYTSTSYVKERFLDISQVVGWVRSKVNRHPKGKTKQANYVVI